MSSHEYVTRVVAGRKKGKKEEERKEVSFLTTHETERRDLTPRSVEEM